MVTPDGVGNQRSKSLGHSRKLGFCSGYVGIDEILFGGDEGRDQRLRIARSGDRFQRVQVWMDASELVAVAPGNVD